jgi:hypothetical protein
MSAADKSKLDGIAPGANNYTHPTGDGNLHVPATGTTNNGKVLKAGSTAGSIAWGNVAFSELTGKPTTLSGYGITDAAPSSHVGAGGTAHAVATTSAAGFMSAADKAKLDGITAGATAGTATPLMDGTAAVGTSTAYAREDHRHPTDTTRAPLASPAFTGTPTAPTAAAGTNNTQIATTAFVNTAIAALPFNMARQAIINGNFDIWQRGTSFSAIPSNRLYYADRWCSDGFRTAATSISRQTLAPGTIPGATYCHRFSTGGAGSGYANDTYCRTMQLIEHGTRLLAGSGNKITVSFWARSSIANKKFGLMLSQEYGSGGSPSIMENIAGRYFTLTSSWQKFTHTFTLNSLSGKTFGTNNDDRLVVQFWYAWGSNHASLLGDTVEEQFRAAGDIDIAQVQVNAGDTALPFQPRSWAEELALCQRYFEKSYDYDVAPGTASSSGAENVMAATTYLLAKQNITFKVPKRVPPTVNLISTQNGTSARVSEYNISSLFVADRTPYISSSGKNGFTVQSLSGDFTANSFIRFQWTADAEL